MAFLKRAGWMIAAAFVLGGCALPMPIKVASWAIDGISYLSTKKTVTDHGMSLALGQDCALLRVVTEKGQICSGDASSGTVVVQAEEPAEPAEVAPVEVEVAALAPAPEAPAAPTVELLENPALVEEPALETAAHLAEFDTAAGGGEEVGGKDQVALAPVEAPVAAPLSPNAYSLPEDAALLNLWQGGTGSDPNLMAGLIEPQPSQESEEQEQLASLDPLLAPAGMTLDGASTLPEGREIIARWEDVEIEPAPAEPVTGQDLAEELAMVPDIQAEPVSRPPEALSSAGKLEWMKSRLISVDWPHIRAGPAIGGRIFLARERFSGQRIHKRIYLKGAGPPGEDPDGRYVGHYASIWARNRAPPLYH